MKKKIKIGLMINTYMLPHWQYMIIKRIIKSNFSSIDLVIQNSKEIKEKSDWENAIYRLYTQLDKKLYKVKIDAFKLKDARKLLKNIMIKRVEHSFNKNDISYIQEENLDILIPFGFPKLEGDILNSSKYGVWAYYQGDKNLHRGEPVGFWEVMHRLGTMGSTLEILADNIHDGTILYRSTSKTDRFSVFRSKNNSYLKSISLLPRKIEELYHKGASDFFQKVHQENLYPNFYANPMLSQKDLTNFNVLKLVITHFFKIIKEKINNKFYFNQWILLFNFKDKDEISTSFCEFTKIIPPKNKFYADPFVVYEKGKYYIFLEELMYDTNRGHLSVMEINKEGSYSEPVRIIEKPYHLSYPSIIKDKGNYFLIPESKGNRTVELYKSVQFPYQWEFQMNLMEDIDIVDATLFFYKNKWWFFCNMVENDGASSFDELYLFFSDKLETNNWTPHPLNPIISDVTKSRPAGDIFIHNDKLIRPSQNCSFIYGYGMKMNEILLLNEHEYEEIEIASIKPNWEREIVSTHTYSSAGQLTVIDAGLKRRR